jgi:hypothetical protein
MPEKATISRFKKSALPSLKLKARSADNEVAASVVWLTTDPKQILIVNFVTR